MRILLLFAFGFCYTFLQAQISITKSDMPSANDTIRLSQAVIVDVSAQLSKKGSNTWDFSSLKANSQNLQEFKSSFQTPYAFYFFNKVGLKTADSLGVGIAQFKNIYTFYTSSNSVYKAEGLGYSYGGIPLAANYIDDDEIYNLPLNYQDSTNNSFDFKFALPVGNFFSVKLTGRRINVVDGYGSVKTPYKTYSNTLRVKTTINEVDSFITQFASIGFPRNQVIYKWLAKGEKVPVMEVIGNEIAGRFVVTQINYRDKYLGLTIPSLLTSNFDADKVNGVQLDTFKFDNKTTPFAGTSAWAFNPNTVTYVNGTNAASSDPQVVFTADGKYSVTLNSSFAGGSHDTTKTDYITIGVNNTKDLSKSIGIYPNPNSGSFSFKENGIVVRSATDLMGRHFRFNQLRNKVDLLNVPSGIYIIRVKDKSGKESSLLLQVNE